MTLQQTYEKLRDEHGCKDRKSYADRAWCEVCSKAARKEFYRGAELARGTADQR